MSLERCLALPDFISETSDVAVPVKRLEPPLTVAASQFQNQAGQCVRGWSQYGVWQFFASAKGRQTILVNPEPVNFDAPTANGEKHLRDGKIMSDLEGPRNPAGAYSAEQLTHPACGVVNDGPLWGSGPASFERPRDRAEIRPHHARLPNGQR